MKRDILSVLDLAGDLDEVLALAADLKRRTDGPQTLKGKSVAMIFEKSSTRTRVSFEVGIVQLGGHPVVLSQKDTQLGRGETIEDTARVLSRYVDCITYRAFSHVAVADLAKHATVPVINALDDLEHPCQITADLQTIKEWKGDLRGLKIAYIGDGNNVCNSLMLGAALTGMDFVAGCPAEHSPDKAIAKKAAAIAAEHKRASKVVTDPAQAAEGADVIYTDAWISMGQEGEAGSKVKTLRPYQINEALVKNADPDHLFMHCLPAHRGEEVTAEVMDGPNSVVFDQAENRLHAQKAILIKVLG
ncbi:ornithine carbamoyltransferase [Methanomassiliicoccus luminyensis]|uniref:ornithine carbamoyltransferase n=1 Tax=Methanomassiliicoccus luminyensis TaxID=1080712 RepID=UPI00037D1670|nr:ornithine carbamoyltransferase [Methanomassiliicoccus luminyensis]